MFPSSSPDILPPEAARIIIWHQGALGDVLLAGPAWQAMAAQYPQAQFTLVGGAAPLNLFTSTLPVAQVLDSNSTRWLDLYQEAGPLSAGLKAFLGRFDLALVFAPRRAPEFLERWRQAGIPRVIWVPSFAAGEKTPISQLQADHLKNLGLKTAVTPLHLRIPEADRQRARSWLVERQRFPAPRLALAPGSGHNMKNWPLTSYLALAEKLRKRWGVPVWWVLGPAESALERELETRLGGQQFLTLRHLPLGELAAILAEFHLYVGNDSGVSHLAAALQGPRVVVIFGPSDPVIWGPPGASIVTPIQPCAPCTSGRQITCPENLCLSLLPPEKVWRAIQEVFPAE